MVNAAIVVIEDVVKCYGSIPALQGINITISAGEWLNIMGPSGSGKSSLLNLIGGLDRPTSGRIWVDGADLNAMSEDELARFRRERMGIIFQQYYLIPYLNALENVMLAQYFHSIPDEEEARQALERVGLGHRLYHRPSQLSGGEQQRVGIARALINNPKLILADEPMGNLDRKNAMMILDLLHQLHDEDKFTIVLVSHDPSVATKGDRIIALEDGKIVDDQFLGNQATDG